MAEQPARPAADPGPETGRLVEAPDRHQVDYLVVGGIAARAYGALRPTADFDCLVDRSRDNLDRLGAAMRELNARIRAEGLSDIDARTLPARVDGTTLERMEISTWQTDAGPLDILTDIPARDGRRLHLEDLAPDAELLTGAGFSVRAASLDHIIESKEWADRPKDREALGELRAIRDGRRPLDAADIAHQAVADARATPTSPGPGRRSPAPERRPGPERSAGLDP